MSVPLKYVGASSRYFDTVDGSREQWTPGDVSDVADAAALALIQTGNFAAVAGSEFAYTALQLAALAAAGGLTPYATYVNDYGEAFTATSASDLTPVNPLVDCTLPAFGGYWTGQGGNADDTALQAALDYAATFNPARHVMLPPKVCIQNGVYVPTRVHVVGHNYSPGNVGSYVYPHASMSLTTGFMFNMNTEDGVTIVEALASSGPRQCGMFGVFLFVAPDLAGARLVTFAGSCIFHDIRAYRHTQVIKKVPGYYIDMMEFDRFDIALSHDNSEYAIELTTGGGDSFTLSHMTFPVDSFDTTGEKAISVTTGQNGKISHIINGEIALTNVWICEVAEHHCELGRLLVTDSTVAVNDSHYRVDDAATHYPITAATAGTNINYGLALNNVEFLYGTFSQGVITAEVKLAAQYVLHCRNTRRKINMTSGMLSATGIRVANASDALIAAWNNNSWFLSMNGWMLGEIPSGSHSAQIVTDFNGLYNTPNKVTGSGSSTLVNGTTYYYTSQLLLDSGLANGRNQSSAEKSAAIVADNTRVGMAFGWGTGTKAALVRFYRGTATGSYDKYVDVPMIGCLYVADKGDYFMGLPWQSRAAGPVDTITSTAAGKWLVTHLGKVAVT